VRLKLLWTLLGLLTLTLGGVAWKNGWLRNDPLRMVASSRVSPRTNLGQPFNLRGLPPSLLQSGPSCGQIYDLVCKRPGIDQDPTGTVRTDEEGEKAAHEIYGEIIRKNPDWTSEQVDDEFVQKVYTPKNRAKILSAFHLVRRTLARIIDQEPGAVFTLHEKTQIKERLRKVQLQLPPPAQIYEDEPDLLTKSEFLYERKITGETALRVGGAYLLLSKSWFNMIFSLAHELGHSIDPCEIRSAGMSFPAYDRLVGCFLEHHLIAMRNTRSECGVNDQLSETFADWIAVQVTAEALSNYSNRLKGSQILHAAQNSVRDLCEAEADEQNQTDLELHPSSKIRIEEVFGKNPKIQKILGCDTQFVDPRTYCEFGPRSPAPPGGM